MFQHLKKLPNPSSDMSLDAFNYIAMMHMGVYRRHRRANNMVISIYQSSLTKRSFTMGLCEDFCDIDIVDYG